MRFPPLLFILLALPISAVPQPGRADEPGSDRTAQVSMRPLVEADWLQQAQAYRRCQTNIARRPGTQCASAADAAGAVDGVKDGKYAFHTAQEANPWWQVDLGCSIPIAKVVVFNRLDYAPGLHNADSLRILTSEDGNRWTSRHDNQGKHFGGISGAEPLEVSFGDAAVSARFVRLQIPSEKPIFFHLDEVEIFGPEDGGDNLALRRPADQSSTSQWSTDKLVLPLEGSFIALTKEIVRRGRRLAADLAPRNVDATDSESILDDVETQLGAMGPETPAETQQRIYFRARWAVRRLAFSNPLLSFKDLLLVKRFNQQTYPDVCLNHMPWVSRPGGDICVIRLAGPDSQPRVRHVLQGALGPGHVHGIDLDWGAERVIFGYAKARSDQPPDGWMDRRTNFDLRRNEEPIHLFEIGVDGSGLQQLTTGQWSDLDPSYLPNGDIVFVSERCGCSLQCNEYDKDETSCNIYVMKPDGNDIRRLSASKDGDYLPHVLDDGTIGYTRWEYQERGWAHIQSIWIVRPDGTGADALFKQHLNDPWALEDARSIPAAGNRKLVAIATGHHTLAAGPVVVVTPSDGMNDSRSIRVVTPGVAPPEGGMSGSPVAEGGVVDDGGYYMHPWPLSKNYFLASYTYSQQQNDPIGYAVYLIDVFGNKELVYRDPKISCFTPIPLRPRQRPDVVSDVTDPNATYATCSVSSIATGVDGVDRAQVRYLRIAERLVWPYDNESGGQRYHEVAHTRDLVPNWTPVRILGEVPVEPDGSAHFRVPADTPVYFQLLDANHMELRRMRSFISFQAGERRGCVGCHETREEAPPVTQGMPIALLREPSIPTPPPWGQQPLSFLRDVQPIFDRHCVSCHGGLEPADGLDLSPGLTRREVIPAFAANRAYDTIRARGLVARSDIHDDAKVTPPLAFGSHRSKLVEVLRAGACSKRAALDDDEWLRLATWIDANAPYHDQFINKRSELQPYDLPSDEILAAELAAIHGRRCQHCHSAAEVTQLHWIDLREPESSLMLSAPLAAKAGGAQKCGQPVYQDRSDRDYCQALELIQSAVQKAWSFPRRDLAALSRESPSGP